MTRRCPWRTGPRAGACRQAPGHGEFIATYAKATDIETGKPDAVRTAFAFSPGAAVPVPESGSRPDYIIHSHPFDPRNPRAYGPCDELGGDFPSGTDRHLAQDKATGEPQPKQLLMHGDRAFLIHAGDLHFTLLDPSAKERTMLADPARGHGWDQDLYFTPHPTPRRT